MAEVLPPSENELQLLESLIRHKVRLLVSGPEPAFARQPRRYVHINPALVRTSIGLLNPAILSGV